jgi:hypothetical protein
MEGNFISRGAIASGDFASISLERAIPPIHLAKQRETDVLPKNDVGDPRRKRQP